MLLEGLSWALWYNGMVDGLKFICQYAISTYHHLSLWFVYIRYNIMSVICLIICLMVFNATFNIISVISLRSVLLVEETGAPR